MKCILVCGGCEEDFCHFNVLVFYKKNNTLASNIYLSFYKFIYLTLNPLITTIVV